MFTSHVQPRFSETDALGHINNRALSVWFEEARTPIFRIFNPELSYKFWNLILARVEVDFVRQIFHGREVEIRTGIQKIGNTSCVVAHEAFQDGQLVSKCLAILIHFDYQTQKAAPIPDDIRLVLSKHPIQAHGDAKQKE